MEDASSAGGRNEEAKTSTSAGSFDAVVDHIEGRHKQECPYGCPVCSGIELFKKMGPDVTSHLASAARELALAAKAFLDTVADAGTSTKDEDTGERDNRIRKIPIE